MGPCVNINLDAIRINAQLIRKLRTDSKILAVVKADAYGHGMVKVVQALLNEVDGFAVARIEEAITLRQTGINKTILLFGLPLNIDAYRSCIEHDIDIEIFDLSQFQWLQKQGYLNHKDKLWVKVDTGMNRIGLSSQEFEQLLPILEQFAKHREVILMSHLSSADETDNDKTRTQYNILENLTSHLPCSTSLLNSSGIIAWPDIRDDWIRPGLMLYGINPLNNDRYDIGLIPAMHFTAPVISVKTVKRGTPIGYNETFVVPEDYRIAILGIGYADGYPVQARSGTPVIINDQIASTVGRVSMDLMAINISDIHSCQTGDRATLWGEYLSVNTIATQANTISYQLLTAISNRVHKYY